LLGAAMHALICASAEAASMMRRACVPAAQRGRDQGPLLLYEGQK
jgi:hypothetical protein